MTPNSDPLTELEDTLAEIEGQPHDDILNDLKKTGVDTENFLARARSAVQSRYRAHLRQLAKFEQGEPASSHLVQPRFENMDREMMLASIDRIQDGEMGNDCKEALQSRGDSDATAMTDEELRLWLADIAAFRDVSDSEEEH